MSKRWIQTHTGKQFFPLDPSPDQVDIEDIAHALSMQCRYAGHCDSFYSVAQHSVLVSRMVPQEHALCALLHDATEAYISDVPSPVKHGIKEFCDLEDRIWRLAIAPKFDLPQTLPKEVKEADYKILAVEKRDVVRDHGYDWGLGDIDVSLEPKIHPLHHQLARSLFMNRFHELRRLTW